MSWVRFLRRSIARKFGVLYALLFALIAGIGVLVIVQIRAMELDARILVEETREHVIARDVLTLIESLEALVDREPGRVFDREEREQAIETLHRISSDFRDLTHDHEDPSRAEHEEKEVRLLASIEDDLRDFEQRLGDGTPSLSAGASLERVRTFLTSLLAETRQEYVRANADLQSAGERTSRVLAGAVAAALLVLGTSLVLVFRGVIDPVRRLRAGARTLGEGDLSHRIELANTDELGALAQSFNEMADRVSDSHAELEERVATRTREFIRAARLADLGVLAAGVAHEINNPLASISASAEGLRRRLGEGAVGPGEVDDYLSIIQAESQRAKAITTRLLELSRQDQDEVSEFELGLALDHVQKAARPVLEKNGISLDLQVRSPGARVVGNAGELTQICLNLLGNAKDASPPGSRVRLECGVQDGHLLVHVTDEGHGIPPEHLDRIFEPFFTTKKPGNGTGLGLALVEAMVQARGGSIAVRSRLNKGTRFTVDLPLAWRTS